MCTGRKCCPIVYVHIFTFECPASLSAGYVMMMTRPSLAFLKKLWHANHIRWANYVLLSASALCRQCHLQAVPCLATFGVWCIHRNHFAGSELVASKVKYSLHGWHYFRNQIRWFQMFWALWLNTLFFSINVNSLIFMNTDAPSFSGLLKILNVQQLLETIWLLNAMAHSLCL